MSDTALRTVTMRMSRQDIEMLELLREWTEAENGATVVSSALGITHDLVSKVRRGEELLIRHRDGTVGHLKFEGLPSGRG